MDIKRKFIRSIEKTGDPLAPIKLKEAYTKCVTVGRLMATMADEKQTVEYSEMLLKAFPAEMDHIASDPNFICALASLFSNALAQWASALENTDA